jgi:hypothetical protein
VLAGGIGQTSDITGRASPTNLPHGLLLGTRAPHLSNPHHRGVLDQRCEDTDSSSVEGTRVRDRIQPWMWHAQARSTEEHGGWVCSQVGRCGQL